MLSILIPIYQFDVRELVNKLVRQCDSASIVYEIVCIDDVSDQDIQTLNSDIISHTNVRYSLLEKNIGRASIRNQLMQAARFEHLLFLDCDSSIVRDDFIIKYLANLDRHQVIYGGRIYQFIEPVPREFLLHYLYGMRRESKSVQDRVDAPYKYFHSNNFIVKKSVMEDIPFDESLRQYGHEDSYWAMELEQQNIEILHIDNPISHLGLEASHVFLRKQSDAIHNIYVLNRNHKSLSSNVEKIAKILNRFYLSKLVFYIYKLIEKPLVKNLLSSRPNLVFLDIYKLGLYLRMDLNNHESH